MQINVRGAIKISFILLINILLFTVFLKNISAQVVINEFLPKSNQEWVEFYNSDESSVDLSEYYFDDDTSFDSDSGSSAKIHLQGIIASHALCYKNLSSFLNDGGDTPTLFQANGDLIDSYNYTVSIQDKSYSRIPDGGEWQVDQIPNKASLSCSELPLSTPVPTPTSISTILPGVIKSIYKINTPKDSQGNILSSVQIYVDGGYIHHEDDEIFEFFNGHECYPGIECGLGTHTVSLRKSGYISWEDTRDFTAGANFEVTPMLNKQDTQTPTLTPKISPTSTPTKTPKPTPTKTPTPTDTLASESAVLGVHEGLSETSEPTPKSDIKSRGKLSILPFILMFAGLCFIAVPIFSIIRNGKKGSEVS